MGREFISVKKNGREKINLFNLNVKINLKKNDGQYSDRKRALYSNFKITSTTTTTK